MSKRERITRPCLACGRERSCRWSIDAWVCMADDCGAEWHPDDDQYQPPSETLKQR